MPVMNISRALVGIVGSMLASCSPPKSSTTAPPGPKGQAPVSFIKTIKPLLSNKCTICHCTEVMPNRPWFETRKAVLASGMLVPGKPDLSRILTVIKEDPAEVEQAMPPVSHRLTPNEIAQLRRWIAEGANWPEGEAGRVKPAFIPRE